MKRIIIFFIAAVFLASPVYASEEKDAIIKRSGADSLLELVPEDMPENEARDLFENGNAEGMFSAFLSEVKDTLVFSFPGAVSFFAGVCAILIMCAVMDFYKDAAKNTGFGKICEWFFVLALAVFSYSALSGTYRYVCDSVLRLNDFMLAALPVATGIWALGGNISKAAAESSSLMFTVGVIDTLLSRVLLPLVRFLFAFSIIGAMGDNSLKKITSFIKKLSKTLIVLLFTVLSAVLFFQSALTGAQDSLKMRGIRFAAGNFIPVVGSLVGETSKTLAASLGIIRSNCGVLCIFIVLFLILSPVVTVWIKRIFLSLAATLGGVLKQSAAESFLTDIGGIFELLLAVAVSSGVYYIFFITLFIKSTAVWS